MSSSIDNILEILLRLVRGERASHHPNQYAHTSHSPLHSALGSAVSSPNAPHAAQQTHVSLAVLAIFRMSAEYAEKAGEETGKVEERVGEIVRALPQHLIYKSLDGIFREWSGSSGFSNTSGRKPGPGRS
jgi:20S proteasome subunit alpha 6